jgi:hypothetical protein
MMTPVIAHAVKPGLLLRLGGLALLLLLLPPWWSGTDDGEPLKIAGWDTEPGFTAAMVAAGLGLAAFGSRWRAVPALVCAIAALALTVWMPPRGDLFSGYHVLVAGYAEAALAAVLVVVAVADL